MYRQRGENLRWSTPSPPEINAVKAMQPRSPSRRHGPVSPTVLRRSTLSRPFLSSPHPAEPIVVEAPAAHRPPATTLPALPSVVPDGRPTPASRPPMLPLMPPIPVPIIPPPSVLPRPLIPAPRAVPVPITRYIRIHIGPPAPPAPRPPIPIIPIPPIPLRRRRPRRQAPPPLPRRPPFVARPRARMPRAPHAVPPGVRVRVHPRRRAVGFRPAADGAALGSGRERGAPVLELAPVELVALLEGRQVGRVGGERRHLEVRVLEGVAGVYPRFPV